MNTLLSCINSWMHPKQINFWLMNVVKIFNKFFNGINNQTMDYINNVKINLSNIPLPPPSMPCDLSIRFDSYKKIYFNTSVKVKLKVQLLSKKSFSLFTVRKLIIKKIVK